MDINAYLQRMGIDHVGNINLEELERLQYHHMIHIPFENLDVMHGVPIELDIGAFYKKVVENHRGGFCYELNGLFYKLLQHLGYQCQLVSATINRPDGTWARTGSHACTIVTLNGSAYLVDVGFGDSSRGPVPLTGEIHQDVSGIYRMKKVDTNIYDMERKRSKDGEWDIVIRIDMTPMNLTEFASACVFNQTSPDSPFTQKEIVTIATIDGRITLSGDTLTITTRNGEKHQEAVNGDTEKTAVLKKYFQINRTLF